MKKILSEISYGIKIDFFAEEFRLLEIDLRNVSREIAREGTRENNFA